jgi:putative transcriptional regulator
VAGQSLAPGFLIAMPQLRDPNFRRTVVLLVHHDEDGTFGVVLNRPTEITAMGLCSTLDLSWCGPPEKGIDWGGPVQPQTGWLVMGEPSSPSIQDEVKEVADGIYFAGSLEVLRNVAAEPPRDLHLMLGYAGWGPGQLESELAEGAWILAPVSHEAIFEVEPNVMWDHVLRSMGIDPSTLIASRGIH